MSWARLPRTLLISPASSPAPLRAAGTDAVVGWYPKGKTSLLPPWCCCCTSSAITRSEPGWTGMLCKAGHASAPQLWPQTLLGLGEAPGPDPAAGQVCWGVSLLHHPARCRQVLPSLLFAEAPGCSRALVGLTGMWRVTEHADEKAVQCRALVALIWEEREKPGGECCTGEVFTHKPQPDPAGALPWDYPSIFRALSSVWEGSSLLWVQFWHRQVSMPFSRSRSSPRKVPFSADKPTLSCFPAPAAFPKHHLPLGVASRGAQPHHRALSWSIRRSHPREPSSPATSSPVPPRQHRSLFHG